MEVVFKATDGTLFTSAQNCLDYERQQVQRCDWKGWSFSGVPTKTVDETLLVYFESADAAEVFLEDAATQGDDAVKGIDLWSEGWFYWDGFSQEYHPLEDGLIELIAKVSAS